MQSNNDIFSIIQNSGYSAKTKSFFKKMYVAYYNNIEFGNFKNTLTWTKSYIYSTLSFWEKVKLYADFNINALLFGPIYYFINGLVVKGIILAFLAFFIGTSKGIFSICFLYIFLFAGFSYNKDMFLKLILSNKEIMLNTDILNGECDENELFRIFETEKADYAPIIVAVVASVLIIHTTFISIYKDINDYSALKIPNICTSETECISYIQNIGKPTKAEDFYNIACANINKNDLLSAKNYLNVAIKLNKNYTKAYILLAGVDFEQNNYNDAVINYNIALKKNPHLQRLNYNLGRCYYRMKNYPQAIKYLNIAIETYPLCPEYVEVRAYSYIGLKNLKLAKLDLEKAMSLYSVRPTSTAIKRKKVLERYYATLK